MSRVINARALTKWATFVHCHPDRQSTAISQNLSHSISSMPLPLHAGYRPRRTCKAHLIPVEILSEIFLLIAEDSSMDRKNLMLVCRRWHAIMLSTPGIPAVLWIGRSTTTEVVQAAIQRRRWLLNLIVDPNNRGIQGDWNANEFHACFTTAIEAASRWRSLEF